MRQLATGDKAPDFSLPLDNGSDFHLAAHTGSPVVLFFYPQDGTPGCNDENREFSDLADEFTALGATLVGISPDTIQSHQKFRARHDLKVPLAADPNRVAIQAYGLWQLKKLYGREFMGLIRTSFIIAADGTMAAAIKATRIRGHAQKVLDTLAKHLSEQGAK